MSWFRLLLIVIGSIFMDFAFLFAGCRFLKEKIQFSIKNIMVIIGLLIFTIINCILSDNVLRVSVFYLVIMSCYKLLFKKEYTKCAFTAFASYFLVLLSEVVFATIVLTFGKNHNILLNELNNYNFVLANFFISLIVVIIVLVLGGLISKVVNLISDKNKVFAYGVLFVIIGMIAAILSKISVNRWMNDENFWLNTIILFGTLVSAFTLLKQFYNNKKLEDRYDEFLKYASSTEKLLEQYRVIQHENVNEIIIIRSMVNKNNTKLLTYLKQTLDEKDNIENKWINNLKYLPFGGLKGVIHYKISEMKEAGVGVHISISKDVQNSKLTKLDNRHNEYLCKIICIFLDNAVDAVRDLKNKKVIIDVYCEKKSVIFEIANNYTGSIDIDSINKKGISSKGKGRGYGLYIVQNILEKSNRFEHITLLEKDLFIQKLTIK